MEMLTGLKRAGSDLIITYFSKEVARWIWKKGIESCGHMKNRKKRLPKQKI
jgi:hypothetical protein